MTRSAGVGGANATTSTPVIAPGAPSTEVTMRWLPSSSPGVVRYDLSIGRSPGQYDTTVRIPIAQAARRSGGVLAYTVTLQSDVDHYVALRAYDGHQISAFSNEIRVAADGGGGGGAGASAARVQDGDAGGGDAAMATSHAGAGSAAPASADSDTSDVSVARAVDATDGADDPLASATPRDAERLSTLSSIDLDGAGEYLGNLRPSALGTNGPITLALWLRPVLDYASRRILFDARTEEGDAVGRMTLALLRGEDLELTVLDRAGAVVQRSVFELAPADDVWQQLVVVYDPGSDLEPSVFLDLAPCTLLWSESTGGRLGIPDTGWSLRLGGSPDDGAPGFMGRIGHAAIWAEAVSLSALGEVHALGHEVDLRLPRGDYASDRSLVHYWRLGDGADPIGYDLGVASATPIDLDDPAGGIDAHDVVPDGPASVDAPPMH